MTLKIPNVLGIEYPKAEPKVDPFSDEHEALTFHPLEPPVPKQRVMRKLARSQMLAFKKQQIIKQGWRCPISGKRFDPAKLEDAVIDHDHITGEIRGILSRSANAAEGKVKNAVARWGGTGENYDAILAFLKRLVQYLESPGTGLIYPFHKSADEKRLDRNKAAREARAKAKAKAAIKARSS